MIAKTDDRVCTKRARRLGHGWSSILSCSESISRLLKSIERTLAVQRVNAFLFTWMVEEVPGTSSSSGRLHLIFLLCHHFRMELAEKVTLLYFPSPNSLYKYTL